MAVRGRERVQQPAGPGSGDGDADVSHDSTPLLPPAAVAEREAADAQADEVHATPARETDDADAEFGRRLAELGSAAARLGAVSRARVPADFEATCGLVRALVSGMRRCLEAGRDEQVLLAVLPGDLIQKLDRLLSNKTAIPASTQKRGDTADGGRESPLFGQNSTTRTWLKERFGF